LNKLIPIILGLIIFMLSIWVLLTSNKLVRQVVERLDNLAYDLQLRTRVLTGKPQIADNIAIIDIDDRSLKTEGRWPWSRVKLSELITALTNKGAVVMAFDIFFSEAEINIADKVLEELNKKELLSPALIDLLTKYKSLFDHDAILAKNFLGKSVVLAIGFLPRSQIQNLLPTPALTLSQNQQQSLNIVNAAGYISNISILQNASAQAGFINIFADSDGIIRRAPLLIQYEGKVYPSLALRAVMEFFGENIDIITEKYDEVIKLEGIKLGTLIIPTDERGQVFIPFVGRSFTFPYYSATDVLHNKLPKDALLGKILFIGTSATGLGDLHSTAVQSPFPGVEIQATLVNGILKNNFSFRPAWVTGANLFITIFLGLISAIFFPFLGPRQLGSIILLVPSILLFLNNWIWIETKLILSFLIPVISVLCIAILNIIYGYLFETRKRERLKEMFGQYVPATHIDEMLKSTSDFALQGEDREMSVLFADIRNFTSISENLSATALVEMLNTFFTPMTEIIFKHQGTIDKYVGDLIMAFWGAPLKDLQHTSHAISAALEMCEQVKVLASVLEKHEWPPIRIGIGINSGRMSVGDMGSQFRRNYTVLGDEVNLASRVESLTKFYGVNIIITQNTAKDQVDFIFRKLDKVRVKGKKTGIEIYEVICGVHDLTKELKKELASYHQALEYYFSQQWQLAYDILSDLHKEYPDKKIYEIYINRIQEFMNTPASPDWDGIYIHANK